MALTGCFEPRVLERALAGILSAALHLGMLLAIVLPGGRHDGVNAGETPITQMVLLEAADADHRDGAELPPLEPAIPMTEIEEQLHAENLPPASLPVDAADPDLARAEIALPDEPPAATDPIATSAISLPSTFVMPQAEQSALSQRLERLAEEFANEPHAQVAWEAGRQAVQRSADPGARERRHRARPRHR